MAVKVKPVQASEIKDIKIAHEAIEQVRRKPTPEVLVRMREIRKSLERVRAESATQS
jgi:hypothetical protein